MSGCNTFVSQLVDLEGPALAGDALSVAAARQGDSPDLPFFDFFHTHPQAPRHRDHVSVRLGQL